MSLRSWRMLLLCAVPALLTRSLHAQEANRWACRADSLSGYNCAHYYSGTVTLSSELKGAVRETKEIVATVTAGRVRCKMSGSKLKSFEVPGMLAVEHEAAQRAGGGYRISVWCPEKAGDSPHRGTDPQIQVMPQQAASYDTLEGKDVHENPDADPVNGITGNETITWALRRT